MRALSVRKSMTLCSLRWQAVKAIALIVLISSQVRWSVVVVVVSTALKSGTAQISTEELSIDATESMTAVEVTCI